MGAKKMAKILKNSEAKELLLIQSSELDEMVN